MKKYLVGPEYELIGENVIDYSEHEDTTDCED
jgi:hypothetical protein